MQPAPREEPSGSAVRVIRVAIPSPDRSEELFGGGMRLAECEVVCQHMLPAPPCATLQGVSSHGLSLRFDPAAQSEADRPAGLLVPWSQIAYVRFFAR